FDGAFGGVGDKDVVVGEGVVMTSSSLEMLTNSCLGGIMVSLIFLKGLVEEALEELMEYLFQEDDKISKKGSTCTRGPFIISIIIIIIVEMRRRWLIECGGRSGMTTSYRATIPSRFSFSEILIASSSSKLSSTKGDVLEGG
nr:hypothetical protein [Tanacetum cinerariifolium]